MSIRSGLFGIGGVLIGIGAPVVSTIIGFPTILGVGGFIVGALCVLVGLLLRSSRPKEPTNSGSNALRRHAEQFAQDVGNSFMSPSGSLYVARDIEPLLLDRLVSSSEVQIVTGEAGAGKTSLLWSLHQQLQSRPGCSAVLASATWMISTDTSASLSSTDILLQHVDSLPNTTRAVVLLDTIDLVLHDSESRLRFIEVIRALSDRGVGVALSTRPSEQQVSIPADLGVVVRLDRYSEREIGDAVTALVKRYCPAEDPVEALRLVLDSGARGLPVLEVCERPLLLRLMFELSEPHLPNIAETDVTSIYRNYWSKRVEEDLRLGANRDDGDSGIDYSSAAEWLALYMLGAGSPEVPETVLSDRPRQGQHDWAPGQALDALERRGVIGADEGRVSFFHQTMFEFAAARALRRRNGAADMQLLLNRVLANPLDLYVAAVLEQYLLLAGEDLLEVDACRRAVVALINSRAPALVSHAMTVVAHYPRLLLLDLNLIGGLTESQVIGLVDNFPTSVGTPIADQLQLMDSIWLNRGPKVAMALTKTLTRLSSRWPAEVRAFNHSKGVVEYFLGAGGHALANPPAIITLQLALFDPSNSSDLDQFRRLLVRVDEKGRQLLVRYLHSIGDRWASIGTPLVHDAVFEVVLRLVRGRDGDGRDIREALGRIRFLNIVGQNPSMKTAQGVWQKIARAAIRRLEKNQADVEGSAELYACLYFIDLGEAPLEAIEVVDTVLTIPPFAASKRIATHFLVPLLLMESSIQETAIDRFRSLLEGLPVVPNHAANDSEQWALLARIALEDERLAPELVAQLAGPITRAAPDLWKSRDGLVSVLASGAVANAPGARAFLGEIEKDPSLLQHGERVKFLNEAHRFLDEPAVARTYVALALTARSWGRLLIAAQYPAACDTLRHRKDELRQVIMEGVAGNEQSQKFASNLWEAVTAAGIIEASVDDIFAALRNARHAMARSHLIKLLITSVALDPGSADRVVRYLGDPSNLRSRPPRPQSNDSEGNSDDLDNFLEQVADSQLTIAALHQNVFDVDWSRYLQVARRRRATGRGITEIGMFRPLNRYLTRLATEDQTLAAERLIELGVLTSDPNFTHKQRRDVANYLMFTMRSLAKVARLDVLELLIASLPVVPTPFAQALIRALSLRRFETRPLLERAMSSVGPAVADYIAENLRADTRKMGVGAFTEILY